MIGGHVGVRIDPNLIEHLAAGRWIAVVSSTNGKTTTNRMLTEALLLLGPVTTNAEGSNLRSGLTTSLAERPRNARASLEVDEATLAVVADELRPDVFVLGNLSRDQLDRYGEVRIIAERWRRMFAASEGGHVVANADDPLVVWASQPASSHTWVAAGIDWTSDAAVCPACRAAIVRDNGGWRCSGCELTRPTPDYSLTGGHLSTPSGMVHEVTLGLPGNFNIANAALAVAAAAQAGVAEPDALAAISTISEVAGRYRRVNVDGRDVRLLMAKNPAGWQQSLAILSSPDTPVVVGINARVADGHDPSWLWDVPFESLAGRRVVAAGDRARDLSVRLHYAGVEHETCEGPALAAIGTLPPGNVDLVANYTVFADTLSELKR